MRFPIYQVDAFTGELFRGNPAAVVLLHEWLPDELMAAIAAENNLSETAFVVPLSDSYELRWFTPKVEVDLCGHATLATAFVLFEGERAGESMLEFRTQSGVLTVERHGDLLTLDFPARPGTPVDRLDEVEKALGARPTEVLEARDLMAVFGSEGKIAALRPDFDRLAALSDVGVIATASGTRADFVYRFFAPATGVPEDPATGSANCTLVPYWAARLGTKELHAFQLSSRVGEFFCEDRADRVAVAGRARLYMTGEIDVPPPLEGSAG